MDSFCRYFAEGKSRYTAAEIAEKRESVLKMIEEEVGVRVTVANIKDRITPEILMKIINKIDDEFFENKLVRAFSDDNCIISACIENRCTKVAGRCHYKKTSDSCARITIKLMSKVFIDSFKDTKIAQRSVDDIKCNNILECLLLTLEHELVHAILFCKCKEWDSVDSGAGNWSGATRPTSGHSKTFMSILFNVFGHTKFQHSLKKGMVVRSTEEEQYTSSQLNAGDVVVLKARFGSKASADQGWEELEKYVVRISDINRRKTVSNNISGTIIEGPRSGESYLFNVRMIIKKISSGPMQATMPPHSGKVKTQKKSHSKHSKRSGSKTQKKSPSKPNPKGLIYNLNIGDEVIMNGRVPNERKLVTLLVKITDINRKKKLGITVTVLDKGPFYNDVFVIGENNIPRTNPLLPASEKVGRKISSDFDTLESIGLTHKPSFFGEDEIGTVDMKKMEPSLQLLINRLPKYNWPEDKKPNDFFPTDAPLKRTFGAKYATYFVAKLPNDVLVLGDTRGTSYMRAGVILKNWQDFINIDARHYPDIWPAPSPQSQRVKSCTTRNPEPPCGTGMEERARPNGEICCYKKGKKTVKKKTPVGESVKKKSKSAKGKKGATCHQMYSEVPKAVKVLQSAAEACGVDPGILMPFMRRINALQEE